MTSKHKQRTCSMEREHNRIRDIRAYLKSYFNTAAGKQALNPPPLKRVDSKGRTQYQHRNPMMAQALYEAAHDKK